jgi:hypothetical protein
MWFPAASKGGGMNAGFPDVCKTPAPPSPFVPVPYPNMAQVRNSSGTVSKVKICNKDTVVESSAPSSSNGDEAGTLKGMVKPQTASKSKFLKGSTKVKAQGKKMVPHLTPTSHNDGNLPAGGVHCAPSQTKVLVHV